MIASACSGHGFKFGVVIGRILADLATRGATPHDIGRFRLDRPPSPADGRTAMPDGRLDRQGRDRHRRRRRDRPRDRRALRRGGRERRRRRHQRRRAPRRSPRRIDDGARRGAATSRRATTATALFAATLERFGKLDILVNNAALTATERHFLEADDAWWDSIIARQPDRLVQHRRPGREADVRAALRRDDQPLVRRRLEGAPRQRRLRRGQGRHRGAHPRARARPRALRRARLHAGAGLDRHEGPAGGGAPQARRRTSRWRASARPRTWPARPSSWPRTTRST